jgi:uncharacterized protein YecT (DUF1311 family)
MVFINAMDVPSRSPARHGRRYSWGRAAFSRSRGQLPSVILALAFSVCSLELHGGEVLSTNSSKTVRVEQSDDGIFIVQGNNESQRAKLPGEGLSLPDEFHISPDGQWIFGLRHVGSGLRAGDLFQLTSPTKVEPRRNFDELAWTNAAKLGAVKSNFSADGVYAMAFFCGWSTDSKRLLIGLRGGEEKRSMREGFVYFNTRTKTFEFTDYLRKLAKATSPALSCAEPVEPLPAAKELASRLAILDQRLNQAYKERSAKLDKDRTLRLRDTQRDWLKQRDEGLTLYLSLVPAAEKERRRLQYLGDVTAARLDDFDRPLDEDL